ncbi:MAG: hypothetical protein ACE366_00970 [Bradymonadia bacterium]
MWVCLFVCLPCLSYGQTAAAPYDEAANPSRSLSNPISPISDLQALWQGRKSALKSGDAKAASEALAAVKALATDNGLMGLDAFAAALLREAQQAAANGDAEGVESRLALARELAPDLPAIEEVAAALSLELSAIDLIGWVGHTQSAISLRLDRLPDRQLFLANMWSTGLIAMGLVILLFLVVQITRHGFGVYHDLARVTPGALRPVAVLIALAGVAVPLLFGYGPLLLVFPAVALLWGYQKWSERATSLVVLALAVVMPWGAQRIDALTMNGTEISMAVDTLQRNPWDARAEAHVKQFTETHPDAWWAFAILGRALKAQGRLEESLVAFSKAEGKVPDGSTAQGIIFNNLGNALFATGRVITAEKRYLEAKGLLPELPEPRFNLHRLYARTAQAAAADSNFQQASGLDAERVALWVNEDGTNLNRHVKDLPLSAEMLGAHVGPTWRNGPLAQGVWLKAVGPLPVLTLPIAAVVTLLLAGLVTLRQKRLKLTRPCPRCGEPVRQLVPTASKKPDQLCDTCTDLFVRGLPMERRIRFSKEEQIDRHQKLLSIGTRITGLALPGWASVMRGRPISGLILMAMGVFLLVSLLLPHGLFYLPGVLHTSATVGVIVALGIVWLVGAFVAFRLGRRAA